MKFQGESCEAALVFMLLLNRWKIDALAINFAITVVMLYFGQTVQRVQRESTLKLVYRKKCDDAFIQLVVISIFLDQTPLHYCTTGLLIFGIYVCLGPLIFLVSSVSFIIILMMTLETESIGLLVIGLIVMLLFHISLVRMNPNSFSFAEAGFISQGATFVMQQFFSQIYFHDLSSKEDISTFILLTLSSSILGVVLMLPVLYCRANSYTGMDLIALSIYFYICSIVIVLFVYIPSCFYLMGYNPVLWMWQEITANKFRTTLVVYWLLLVSISVAIVFWFSNGRPEIPKTIVRKMFHVLAFLIFIPLYKDIEFVAMVTVIVFVIFIQLELVRVNKIIPLGKYLTLLLEPLREEQDSGPLLLTHIYLLTGLSLPLWLIVADKEFNFKFQNDAFYFLSVYSGVISLCIGDSFASVFGKLIGKTKWPDRNKTYVGTMACFLSMFLFSLILLYGFNFDLKLGLLLHLFFLCLCVSLLESVSLQVDNLVLPLYTFLLCRAFSDA